MQLVKTELGQRVLKDRSIALTPRQRAAFILFDGRRTQQDVLASTQAMGVTQADLDQLLSQGLLAPATAAPQDATEVAAGRTPQQRYQEAYLIATQLTASLGLRGFRLNLAVEGTSSYEQLRALAPRIREAVGAERCRDLDRALGD